MAVKKKQHFVPQFYMRNFADDQEKSLLSLYNFNSGKFIKCVPLKSQNYDDYFYGKDAVIEDALGLIEGVASQVISRVVDTSQLPSRMSEEHIVLLMFALFQSARTPSAAAETTEHARKLVQELAKEVPELAASVEELEVHFANAPAETLRVIAESYPFTLDLKLKLLRNTTNRLFVASDHPVVQYNQFLERRKTFGSNIGLTAKGLQIFFPLGPRHLLMIYDGDVYRVGGCKHVSECVDVVEQDVAALNALQAANAEEMLFFSPAADDEHVAEAITNGRKHRSSEKVAVSQYKVLGDETGSILHTSRVDLRIGLVLPSVAIIPRAAGTPLSDAVVQVRDPGFVRICEDFRSQVEAGRYKNSQFGDFMRDRARKRDVKLLW